MSLCQRLAHVVPGAIGAFGSGFGRRWGSSPAGCCGFLPVIKMLLGCADNLIIFVPLACQQNYIATICKADCQPYRLMAVFNNHKSPVREAASKFIAPVGANTERLYSRYYLREDTLRIFCSRVVRSDDRQIAHVGGDTAHDWALAVVAITATAEEGNYPAGGNFL